MRSFAAVVVLVTAVPVAAQAWTDAKAGAVAALVERLRKEHGIPGIGAAVSARGQVLWAQGFGLADVENGLAVTNSTRFRLGSISKPITAVAAMQLVEQGRLDLDADVRSYVPGFPKKPWPITARQLLSHLGGVRHYQGDEFDSVRRYVSVLDGLDLFKDDPLVHEPGTGYLYSTHGYTLLGAVFEAAASRPFVEHVRMAVLDPAGMGSTRDDDAREPIAGRAQGYFKGSDGRLRVSEPADTSYKIPGGGFIATAPDVARFGSALLEARLVSPASLAAMLTPQKTRAGKAHGYGLGLSVRVGSPREAWHTGGQQRVSTVRFLRPDSRVVVVLLTNLADAPGRIETARRIAEIVDR